MTRELLLAPRKPHASHSGRITAAFVRAWGSGYPSHRVHTHKGPSARQLGSPHTDSRKSSRENLSRQVHLPQHWAPSPFSSHRAGLQDSVSPTQMATAHPCAS